MFVCFFLSLFIFVFFVVIFVFFVSIQGPTTPTSAGIVQSLGLNAGCDVSSNDVGTSLRQNMAQHPQFACTPEDGCQTSISTTCGSQSRQKRSTDSNSLGVTLNMTFNFGDSFVLDDSK